MNVREPDPAEQVFVRQDMLDANPGRPGSPVSIPGYPIETASGGIKAPQYFAPGVAGDHGESIAQFIAVGGYLVPNNLSANAHGNGYADPNILVPQVVESVQIDGGAFNVREGNHSVNLAATYGLRSHLDPFLTVTGDQRDIDATAGVSPGPESWLALEAYHDAMIGVSAVGGYAFVLHMELASFRVASVLQTVDAVAQNLPGKPLCAGGMLDPCNGLALLRIPTFA